MVAFVDHSDIYARAYYYMMSDVTSTSGMIINISPTSVASNYPGRIIAASLALGAPYGFQDLDLPIRTAEEFIRRQKQRKRHVFNKEPKVTNEHVVQLTSRRVEGVIRLPRIERGQKRRMYCQKIRKNNAGL